MQEAGSALFLFVVFPIVGVRACSTAACSACAVVQTRLWGGLLLTLIIAAVGDRPSLPLGILLALGRRSELPIDPVALRHLHRVHRAACR